MDKLRRALSGNEAEDEERGFVAQVARFGLNFFMLKVIFIFT